MKTIIAFLISFVSSTTFLGQVPDKNEWGEKFNSKGAMLVLKESGRTRINGQTLVSYSLFASGLPKDVDYTLWTRLVGGEPQGVANAFVNKDGLVVNVLADPVHKIAEDPINLKVVAGRGEPKQFALISNDGRYRAFGQSVPFPIENTVGSCHISATMLAANYSAVFIVLEGLQPKEELLIDSQSEGEVLHNNAAATDQGTYQSAIVPTVKGKRSGMTRFSITAKSCKVGVEFPWGESSYKVQ